MSGRALKQRIVPGERVHVDLTSPLSAMVFPTFELIIITGLCWIGIGFIDQLPGLDGSYPASVLPAGTRDVLLILWAVLSCWRFVVPLFKQRRYRLTISDRTLMARRSGFSTRYDSIPLSYVDNIHRRRNTLVLNINGQEHPYVLNQVPKAKKVESTLKQLKRW